MWATLVPGHVDCWWLSKRLRGSHTAWSADLTPQTHSGGPKDLREPAAAPGRGRLKNCTLCPNRSILKHSIWTPYDKDMAGHSHGGGGG
jgi:hypothetical protein